jgi:DUF971 family protein
MSFAVKHHPVEIRLKKAEKILEIDYDDGKSFALPAELLRVESPSAEVMGHGPNQKQTVAGRRHVGIMSIDPVGNYAIRIVFDDLHDVHWPGLFLTPPWRLRRCRSEAQPLRPRRIRQAASAARGTV